MDPFGAKHIVYPRNGSQMAFIHPCRDIKPFDQVQDVADGDDVRMEADVGGKGGDLRCQLPCEYHAPTAWKLQRHQNQKQGCIRSFWIVDSLFIDWLLKQGACASLQPLWKKCGEGGQTALSPEKPTVPFPISLPWLSAKVFLFPISEEAQSW